MNRKLIALLCGTALMAGGGFPGGFNEIITRNLLEPRASPARGPRPSFPNQKQRKIRTGLTHRNTHRHRNSVLRHK